MRWIKKLIKLLNEKEWDTFVSIKWDEDHFKDDYFKNHERKIISKRYGFIKWLVENDKIDRAKFWNSETKSSKYSDFELSYDTPREDYTNILLMELAIQDDPVSFLISILK